MPKYPTRGELFNDTSSASETLQHPVTGLFQIIEMKEMGHGILLSTRPGEIEGNYERI
jgi:hypothetical protein